MIMIKCSGSITIPITALTLLCLAGSATGKDAPPPFSGEKAKEMHREIDRLIEESDGVDLEGRVSRYLDAMKSLRANEYDGAVIRVQSKKKEASIGTRVNFSTERKNISFSIKPPIEDLEIVDYAKEPMVEMRRGNASRVEKRKSVAHKQSGIVDFSLTLVEPDLAENDVHVTYWGWVDYSYTYPAAEVAAQTDLSSLIKYAKDRMEGDAAKNSEALQSESKEAAEQEMDQRAELSSPLPAATENTEKSNSVSSRDAYLLAIATAVLGLLGGILLHIFRVWWNKKKGVEDEG